MLLVGPHRTTRRKRGKDFQLWKQNEGYMKWSVNSFNIGFMKNFMLQKWKTKGGVLAGSTWINTKEYFFKNSRQQVTVVRSWWSFGCVPLMMIGLLSVYLLWHKNVRRVPRFVRAACSFHILAWTSWIALLFPHLWWPAQEIKAL